MITSIMLPRSKANYNVLLEKMFERLDLPIFAGGPGSGRHPGYKMPGGIHPEEVKKFALHPTWMKHKDWHQQAYGGILVNKEGKFLLREPTGHFDGYAWTWPKGKMDAPDEHPVDTAVREIRQETGYDVHMFQPLIGTYKSNTGSHSSFFMARPKGQNPDEMDNETRSVKWASYDEAKRLIGQSPNKAGRARDLAILDQAHEQIQKYKKKDIASSFEVYSASGWSEELHPRGPGGKFATTGMTPKESLKFHGWKNKGSIGTDYTRTVQTKHPVTTWLHPTQGKFKYYVASKQFHGDKGQTALHYQGGKMVAKVPLAQLHEYLDKLHNPGGHYAPVGSSKAIPSSPKTGGAEPPTGMAHEYKLTNPQYSSYTYKWNSITKGYDVLNQGNPTGGHQKPAELMNHVQQGDMVPASSSIKFFPPAGMPHDYVFESDPNVTAKFNPVTGKYEKFDYGKKFGEATPDEFKSQSIFTSYKPVSTRTPSSSGKPSGEYTGLPASFKSMNTGKEYVYKNGEYQDKTGKPLSTNSDGLTKKLTSGVFVSTDKTWTGFGAPPASNKPPATPFDTPTPVTPVTTYNPKLNIGPGVKLIKKEGTTPPAPTGPKISPMVSTTPIPPQLNVNQSMFTMKPSQPSLGGAHEKTVFTDHNGNDWLFKPATTLGGEKSPLMAHADEATSRIALALRPGYSVEAKAMSVTVPGKGDVFGSMQKMIPQNMLRGDNGKFKDFTGRNLDTHPLADWETKHLQQEQVLDWLISNHDSHGGQFLRTKGEYVGSRSVIGIDKTQAFKFLGKDQLSTTYHPNTVEKPPFYNEMFTKIKEGKATFDPNESLPVIKAAEGISRADYKDMLKGYADTRFGNDTAGKNAFYDQAIARKENLRSDFEKFYSSVLGQKFEFEKQYTEGELDKIAVDSKGKHVEKLPDSEQRPNMEQTIKVSLLTLGKTYPFTFKDAKSSYSGSPEGINGLHSLNDDAIDKWESNYLKTDPTMSTEARWQKAAIGAGLYPEVAAKIGLLPSDLKQLKSSIHAWKGSGGTDGASYFRAAAADVMKVMNGQQDKLSSRMSAAVQMEYLITQSKIGQLHPDGMMKNVYRGLSATVAADLKAAKKIAVQSGIDTVEYNTMGAEGWSYNKVMGSTYLNTDLATKNCFFHYACNPGCGWGGQDIEKEFFMSFKDKKMTLKPKEIDAASRKGKKGSLSVDGDVKGQMWYAHPEKKSGRTEVITMQYVGEGTK